MDKKGLCPDEKAFVEFEKFMKFIPQNYTKEEVKMVVSSCDKQRFKMEERNGQECIRANQGHSNKLAKNFDDEKMLELIKEPLDFCMHGTNQEAFAKIKKSGLNVMKRKHIHCSVGMPDDEKVISGARSSSQVFLHIDMEEAMKDGIKFYKSDNGVILTAGIEGLLPYKYVKFVTYK